jgi:hypothetical protein
MAMLITAQGTTVCAAVLAAEAVLAGILFGFFPLVCGDKNFSFQPRDGFESHRNRSDLIQYLDDGKPDAVHLLASAPLGAHELPGGFRRAPGALRHA